LQKEKEIRSLGGKGKILKGEGPHLPERRFLSEQRRRVSPERCILPGGKRGRYSPLRGSPFIKECLPQKNFLQRVVGLFSGENRTLPVVRKKKGDPCVRLEGGGTPSFRGKKKGSLGKPAWRGKKGCLAPGQLETLIIEKRGEGNRKKRWGNERLIEEEHIPFRKKLFFQQKKSSPLGQRNPVWVQGHPQGGPFQEGRGLAPFREGRSPFPEGDDCLFTGDGPRGGGSGSA